MREEYTPGLNLMKRKARKQQNADSYIVLGLPVLSVDSSLRLSGMCIALVVKYGVTKFSDQTWKGSSHEKTVVLDK
jgi:hypothetical protein